MLVEALFYLGILVILIHVGREVYLAWRQEEFGDDDLL
jgi:hypothetical protein